MAGFDSIITGRFQVIGDTHRDGADGACGPPCADPCYWCLSGKFAGNGVSVPRVRRTSQVRGQVLLGVRKSGLTAAFALHDAQLREPSVMDLTLVAEFDSQVIQLHGVAIPCRHFRRSENARTNAVLGRVGQELGQSGRNSRSHHLLKRASG